MTLVTLAVTLIYQVLGLFGAVPTVAQSEIINAFGILINIFVVLGVVVDPTTDGISDSANALDYDEPKKEE